MKKKQKRSKSTNAAAIINLSMICKALYVERGVQVSRKHTSGLELDSLPNAGYSFTPSSPPRDWNAPLRSARKRACGGRCPR